MEQYTLPEAFKGMSTIFVALEDFNPVVESFARSIGLAVFPRILDICTVMTNGVGTPLGSRTR